jgi:preprotein translocase subunit SecD
MAMNEGLRNRLLVVLGAVVFAAVCLLPNFSPESFKNEKGEGTWLSEPIKLGLDLRGGVHLMYEVQTKEAVKSRLSSVIQAIRVAFRDDKIAVTRAVVTESKAIEITLLSARNVERAKQIVTENYRDQLSFVEQRAADGERVTLVYNVPPLASAQIEKDSVQQAVETLERRVNQFGVAEPLVQKVGEDRIMLQMPGVQDIESVKRVVGKLAQLEFRFLPAMGAPAGSLKLKDRDGAAVNVEESVQMTGDAVQNARWSTGTTNQVEVLLTLTTEGARTFRRVTTDNVGRNLAIILDGVVYSSPRINEPITGGQAQITGSFSPQEASELSMILRAGALPASLKVLEERTVGPTLGQQSIKSGILASIVGVVGIALFMLFYYRKAGAVAMASICINVFLLIGILSLFGVTLTLPGLAGLALTAGIAVDSNIIIYERIRDELRIGAGRDAAVAAGFDKAYSAIMDSNFTTILAGIILYILGSGPILGFALTLCVGVLTTVFCAVFVCKLFFDFLPLAGSRNGLSI